MATGIYVCVYRYVYIPIPIHICIYLYTLLIMSSWHMPGREQQPGARPTMARFPPSPVLIINLTSDWRLFVLGI